MEPLGQLQETQHLHHGSGRRQSQQGIENLCKKITTEDFPNLVKEIDIRIQEVQRIPNKINPLGLHHHHTSFT